MGGPAQPPGAATFRPGGSAMWPPHWQYGSKVCFASVVGCCGPHPSRPGRPRRPARGRSSGRWMLCPSTRARQRPISDAELEVVIRSACAPCVESGAVSQARPESVAKLEMLRGRRAGRVAGKRKLLRCVARTPPAFSRSPEVRAESRNPRCSEGSCGCGTGACPNLVRDGTLGSSGGRQRTIGPLGKPTPRALEEPGAPLETLLPGACLLPEQHGRPRPTHRNKPHPCRRSGGRTADQDKCGPRTCGAGSLVSGDVAIRCGSIRRTRVAGRDCI